MIRDIGTRLTGRLVSALGAPGWPAEGPQSAPDAPDPKPTGDVRVSAERLADLEASAREYRALAQVVEWIEAVKPQVQWEGDGVSVYRMDFGRIAGGTLMTAAARAMATGAKATRQGA